MDHDEYVQERRAEAKSLAQQILYEQGDYIEACRKISSILRELFDDPLAEGFGIFIVIDSDTDHSPQGEEARKIYEFYKDQLFEACKKLAA